MVYKIYLKLNNKDSKIIFFIYKKGYFSFLLFYFKTINNIFQSYFLIIESLIVIN